MPEDRASATRRDVLRAFGSVGGLALAGALDHERAARLSDLKSQFIALAAHELRAPFAVMHGIITTLEHHDDLPPEQESALRNALLDQTSRTSRLIDQLLDLSRLDANSIPIERRRFRVRERLEDVVDLVAGDRRDEVTLEVPEELEVEADPTAMERIVSNLLVNAFRHGSPPVKVTARQRDTHFRLSVEDRGGGVDSEFVPKLFDRFSRSSQSAQAPGSGLGLAIAQSYAQAHGGELVYARADPHGARFELVLPHPDHPGHRPDATSTAPDADRESRRAGAADRNGADDGSCAHEASADRSAWSTSSA
jgi:two-component system sensor histidine kinase MtrB